EVPREPTSELAARAIDRAAENLAVRSREVDVLEYAFLRFELLEREDRSHARRVDGDDLTSLHLANQSGSQEVERAALRREDGRVAKLADHERTPSSRVAGGKQRAPDDDNEAVRSFNSVQR